MGAAREPPQANPWGEGPTPLMGMYGRAGPKTTAQAIIPRTLTVHMLWAARPLPG